MDISKKINITFENGCFIINPDVLNPHETVLRGYADLKKAASERTGAREMLQKILDNTEKAVPGDFAQQVLDALENEDLIICMTPDELAASAIRDTLCTPQETPNTLQNQATCFRGIMFGDSQASDLMMRSTQSVLRDIIPYFNAVDMIILPNVYQSIIDNTPPDAFCYKNEKFPTSSISSTAFETDPQSVKARIHGALEQIKGAVSDEARQAINDTEARLDSIIASAQEQMSNDRFYMPLNYTNLISGNIPTLSDNTFAIVSEANAIQSALWNTGVNAGYVQLGIIAEVTPHGELLSASLVLRDKNEILMHDATNITPEQLKCVAMAAQISQSAQEAHKFAHFIAPTRGDETPSTDEQDNETPGDLD